jgi:hypothetical protein
MNLIAKFQYNLSGSGLLVCKDLCEQITFTNKIDGFNIFLDINPRWETYQSGNHCTTSDRPYFSLNNFTIEVSRFEPQLEDLDRNLDTSGIQKLILDVRNDYLNVTIKTINNLLHFFKFQLNNPGLSLISKADKQLLEPEWFNEMGKRYKLDHWYGFGTSLPEISSFGISCYTDDEHQDLEDALLNKSNVTLSKELLADARNAIFENSLRRGTLELAVATEVIVRSCLAKPLDRISVTKLIDEIAKQSIGESFKEIESNAFESIEKLFECRNNIVHQGKIEYGQGSNTTIRLDYATLQEWWEAIIKLEKWLSELECLII